MFITVEDARVFVEGAFWHVDCDPVWRHDQLIEEDGKTHVSRRNISYYDRIKIWEKKYEIRAL